MRFAVVLTLLLLPAPALADMGFGCGCGKRNHRGHTGDTALEPCEGLDEGDACETAFGDPGVCTAEGLCEEPSETSGTTGSASAVFVVGLALFGAARRRR